MIPTVRRFTVFILCVLVWLSVARHTVLGAPDAPTALANRHQEPVSRITDFLEPPSTLRELWNAAPVVVRGTVTGRETRGMRKAGRPSPVPHDSHTFTVTETLKGVEVIGGRGQIEVVTATGTLFDSAGAPVRHGSAERSFGIGTELVLFLD